MHTFIPLLHIKIQMLRKSIFNGSRESIIRILSSIIIVSILMYSSYIFFHSLIFSYVASLEKVGLLLIDRLISTTFLLFFIMIIISSFLMTISLFVRSREMEYLLSMPVIPGQLIVTKFFEILLYSSWAVIIMAIPMLLAYAHIHDFGIFEYSSTALLILLPFACIAACIGIITAFGVLRISVHWRLWKVMFVLSVVLSALFCIMISLSRPNDLVIPFTDDFRAMNLFVNNFRMNSHPFTPNFWLIQSLRALVNDRYYDFSLYASALLSTAILGLSFMYVIADQYLFRIWCRLKERQYRVYDNSLHRYPTTGFPRLHKGFTQAFSIVRKDILIFLRQPGQWTQTILLVALTFIYFINLRFLPENVYLQQWNTIIAVINYAFCSFILATLAIRFIYPSISLEGDARWIILTAPVSPKTLFAVKFWTAFVPFLFITELIAIISSFLLSLELFIIVFTLCALLVTGISLVSIAIGLGAIYPDFNEHDPSRIASGPGGLVTMGSSLLYLSCMIIGYGLITRNYHDYLFHGESTSFLTNATVIIGMLSVSTAFVIVSLHFGARAMRKRIW